MFHFQIVLFLFFKANLNKKINYKIKLNKLLQNYVNVGRVQISWHPVTYYKTK